MKFCNIHLSILLLFCTAASANVFSQCNGHPDLCDKRYDEVAYLTTHNGYNSTEDGFSLPNQNFNVSRQLEDGVRGLMLDVYNEDGTNMVYHGIAVLGAAPLTDFLTEIKLFLDDNPTEIVTIIFETYTTSALIEADLISTELMDYLHVQEPGIAWPTLQEMIDANNRLVIFSEQDDGEPDQDWYHYAWEFVVETHFSNATIADFSCDYNRGDASNDLFLLNHFLTDPDLGVGVPDEAPTVNANPFLLDRIDECETIHSRMVNFIAVDFYEIGDCFEALYTLNETPDLSIDNIQSNVEFSTFPNPTTSKVTIKSLAPIEQIEVYAQTGELVYRSNGQGMTQTEIDLSGLNSGLYFIRVNGISSTIIKQ